MPFQLVIISGPDTGRTFPLLPGSPFVIGRGQTSLTKLVDPHVSRNHCEVRVDGGRVIVTDSGSVGGTFVNGQRITAHELKAGDVVRVGETALRFDSPIAEETTLPPTPARTVAPAPAPPPAVEKGAKEVIFAQKARGQAIPKNLQELLDLVGKSLGIYQILQVAGTGTTGVVFQARDGKDQKIIALKVLKSDFTKDEKARQRFLRGIKAACTLSHPNLVVLYTAGMTDGRCWIAQEYIEGESLSQTMKAGKMDWPRAWQVAVHVAKALGYIHGQGVLHRNVMPQNIMIQCRDLQAKLGDVMLAKALEENEGQEVTTSGELVGNIYYLAPERTFGKNAEVDGRADLYSLGATVYSLLTGQLPVQGRSLVEVVTKIRTAVPERTRTFQSAIPDSFDAIVMKLLAKRPEDRFQTAAELLADLDKVQPAKK